MNLRAITTAIVILALGAMAAPAEEQQDRGELAKALQGKKVTLEDGLKASEGAGRPISAKFEVEHGELQLSVYAEKGDGFTEAIVDPETGAVTKTEKITEDEDLEDAGKQKAAMEKARATLLAATEKAERDNQGFRAVSVMPSLKAGHPVADVMLLRGEDFKNAEEKLD